MGFIQDRVRGPHRLYPRSLPAGKRIFFLPNCSNPGGLWSVIKIWYMCLELCFLFLWINFSAGLFTDTASSAFCFFSLSRKQANSSVVEWNTTSILMFSVFQRCSVSKHSEFNFFISYIDSRHNCKTTEPSHASPLCVNSPNLVFFQQKGSSHRFRHKCSPPPLIWWGHNEIQHGSVVTHCAHSNVSPACLQGAQLVHLPCAPHAEVSGVGGWRAHGPPPRGRIIHLLACIIIQHWFTLSLTAALQRSSPRSVYTLSASCILLFILLFWCSTRYGTPQQGPSEIAPQKSPSREPSNVRWLNWFVIMDFHFAQLTLFFVQFTMHFFLFLSRVLGECVSSCGSSVYFSVFCIHIFKNNDLLSYVDFSQRIFGFLSNRPVVRFCYSEKFLPQVFCSPFLFSQHHCRFPPHVWQLRIPNGHNQLPLTPFAFRGPWPRRPPLGKNSIMFALGHLVLRIHTSAWDGTSLNDSEFMICLVHNPLQVEMWRFVLQCLS